MIIHITKNLTLVENKGYDSQYKLNCNYSEHKKYKVSRPSHTQ